MTAPPREKKAYIRSLGEEEVNLSAILSPEEDDITTNDMLLAQMLQYEFDREYDQQVEREERQYNGNSKGTYALYICVNVVSLWCFILSLGLLNFYCIGLLNINFTYSLGFVYHVKCRVNLQNCERDAGIIIIFTL